MSVPRFRSIVGRKQLAKSIGGTARSATLSARSDMAGIIKAFQGFVNHLEDTTPQVLLAALEPAFELSQEYVPKDTGALATSGYLRIVAFRGKPTVEIGYGSSGSPDYAAVVHENLEWRHKAPTQAKYLEAALNETAALVQADIINGLRKAGGF